jgi:hypothetical protein
MLSAAKKKKKSDQQWFNHQDSYCCLKKSGSRWQLRNSYLFILSSHLFHLVAFCFPT